MLAQSCRVPGAPAKRETIEQRRMESATNLLKNIASLEELDANPLSKLVAIRNAINAIESTWKIIVVGPKATFFIEGLFAPEEAAEWILAWEKPYPAFTIPLEEYAGISLRLSRGERVEMKELYDYSSQLAELIKQIRFAKL